MLRRYSTISGEVLWLEGSAGSAWATTFAAFEEFELRDLHELRGQCQARSWSTREPDVYVLAQEVVAAPMVEAVRLRAPATKIYVVESKSSSREREEALLDAGADGYSFVPLPVSTLSARLRALIRTYGASSVERNSAVISLNAEHHELRVPSGKSVRLSPAEFKLAQFLASRGGSWVRREDVFFEVFSTAPRYESSLLRTHIYNIRRKLGASRWLLRSDRGKGVMLAQSALEST